MKKRLFACLAVWLQCIVFTASAADTTDIRFEYKAERINDKEATLSVTARLSTGIQLYAIQQSDTDLLYSTILFDTTATRHYTGPVTEKGAKQSEYDTSVSATVHFYTDSVVWQQKINLAENDSLLSRVQVNYLYKKGDAYLPGEETGKFYIEPVSVVSPVADMADRSLLWIFLTAFGGGLLALLTPCIYSMIPVTVSFFTKRSKTKLEGRKNAVIYSLSIIFIFTFIGFLITLIWGPTALNDISTNWIFNLFIFLVFVVFGISFLGAFEITLPASWSNKADSKANASSFLGIFFMALVLVVVSFSCTGPILGLLLPVIFKGGYAGPLVGFFGFSLALSIPFALFAFFPSWLNSLSKPGGWMNTIKVTLGFIELALALKFLSNADLARGWRLLDREIFIAAWIVIFILLGIYLLGKLKFHHDDELPKNDFGIPYLSVTRLLFATTSLIFAVYMIPGLWGAPLKGISAFVPPMGTQDFNADDLPSGFNFSSTGRTGNTNSHSADGLPKPEKYYEEMRKNEPDVVVNNGMVTYFDYHEALAVSRKLKKPLMLDFTGINCVNCRKMEGQVWSDPKVMERLKNDFVIVSLYVDVHNVYIPQQEQYFSKTLDRQVETLGDLNADMQVTKFGANTQPYYFFLDGNGQRLRPDGYGYDPDINKFIRLLDEVKATFQKGNP
ncbi:cytochrome c biogenesis protein CcdA [Niabella yanshanensis]|uniref:Cytochrome c biogenesis protein CcdA n=1 Tax=Niabella yanshanensis TaxID=577386 RepID=A0ABZ0W8G3_9BACT|nr:cytochrome c biogenesis protein CcdA [Niabella yanshanensis]WQD38959.1 cytochrome c biogenesis protein CcdA [Niabella yanshanensis]